MAVAPHIAPLAWHNGGMPFARSIVVALVGAISAVAFNAPAPASPRDDVAAPWKPVSGRLTTRWAGAVSSTATPWPDYPRPTMVRARWANLNGLWDYAVTPGDVTGAPTKFDGRILVPYPIESALSGVGKPLEPDQRLWYRRNFEIPAVWASSRMLLHFGAVDWEAEVFVNGISVGTHRGGYDPFSFDISQAVVKRPTGPHTLVVAVRDPTDAGGQPRGKQVRSPEGIWYTRSSGIWQTVWIEPVPAAAITGLRTGWDAAARKLNVTVSAQGRGATPAGRGEASPAGNVTVRMVQDGVAVATATGSAGTPIALDVAQPRLWSPDDPFLYELQVSLSTGGEGDAVRSYAGLRDVRVGPDASGVTRILLNGKPLFQFGPLDQGFFPDGLYTPPTPAAMRFDIDAAKRMGCNMLRKHVKVEPEIFYHACDVAGMLVWQDMPNGNNTTDDDKRQFEVELRELVDDHINHPSIVMWVPFNEGWGQHDTKRITELVKGWDPTRLVNNASGWTDAGVGDVIDIHVYPGPGMAPPEPARASVLGEFGGLGLPMEGHIWQPDGAEKKNWGYVSYKTPAEVTQAYVDLIEALPLFIGRGLSAAVYTQTTDVEIEVNGWLTYDRAVWKIDPKLVSAATSALYAPPPTIRVVVPHAGDGKPATWRFVTDDPGEGWFRPQFVDSAWKQGPAGFGTRGTPGAKVNTEWSTPEIWLRGAFELPAQIPAHPYLAIHHDEGAEVYINGELVAMLKGYTSDYEFIALDANARGLLRQGTNSIAIRCRQTRGGQYIDAGIVEVAR